MIVVDASIILHLLIDPETDIAVWNKVNNAGQLIAPHIIDLEIISGIRRHLRIGTFDQIRADQAISDMKDFKIDRRPIIENIQRIWELRNNVTPYDASYLSLAESLKLPLLTRDKKLANAAAAHTKVELI